jgi:hypothetical protein
MATTEKMLEILNSEDTETKTELLRPAVIAAVKCGIIPKYTDQEEYLRNWAAIEVIIKVFLQNAEV